MSEQELDLDNLDKLLEDFDGVIVEGGVDSENDDDCEGGACKI
jgi:identified by metaGeneAnnotator